MANYEIMSLARQINEAAIEAAIRLDSLYQSAEPGTPMADPKFLATRRTEYEQAFSDIGNFFMPFAGMPTPGGFDGPIEALEFTLRHLSTSGGSEGVGSAFRLAGPLEGKFSALVSDLDDWQSQAAENLRANYLTELPAKLANQAAVVAALRDGLAYTKKAWAEGEQRALTVAKEVLAALKACPSGPGSSVGITAIGAILAVAAVPTSGASLGVLTALSQVASVAASATEDPDPPEFGGGSPHEIVGKMKKELNELATKLQKSEDKVAAWLQTCHSLMGDQYSQFAVPAPHIATAGPSQYRDPTFRGTFE